MPPRKQKAKVVSVKEDITSDAPVSFKEVVAEVLAKPVRENSVAGKKFVESYTEIVLKGGRTYKKIHNLVEGTTRLEIV